MDQFIDPIKVDSLAIGDSVFSWITPTDTASNDTNYYTSSDMMVEFTITDPGGLSGKVIPLPFSLIRLMIHQSGLVSPIQ